MNTVYLWKANQSEPGFDLTYGRDTPPPEAAIDWQLIGEVDIEDQIMNNHHGENFIFSAKDGEPYFAQDVYRLKRYRSLDKA